MSGIPALSTAVFAPAAVGLAVAFAAAGSGTLDQDPMSTASLCTRNPVIPGSSLDTGSLLPRSGERLDAAQIANAQIIYTTGAGLRVSARGRTIAIAIAIQESRLRNLNHGDLAGPDSRGLFQQRAAWGPLAVRTNPAQAAAMFYTGGLAGQPGLLDIADWQRMPLTQAAQAVQRSAHPSAYAQWEPVATRLVETFASLDRPCTLDDGITIPGDIAVDLPTGYTIPPGTSHQAETAIRWALAQLGTPYHYGGDCTTPHSGDPAHQCDCSSLTQQAYRRAGVRLPRTTREQITVGLPIYSLQRLRPGDLIFLPGHVGIYLGDTRVLHAPKTGDVVKISQLRGYWTTNITAMRRATW